MFINTVYVNTVCLLKILLFVQYCYNRIRITIVCLSSTFPARFRSGFTESTSKMNLFFDIPDVIQVLIVTQWIRLHEVVMLDSALCNKKKRNSFHRLIGADNCIFNRFSTRDIKYPFSKTVLYLKFKELDLRRVYIMEPSLRRELLARSGSTLECIKINMDHRDRIRSRAYWKTTFAMIGSEIPITLGDWSSVWNDISTYCPNIKLIKLFRRSEVEWHFAGQDTSFENYVNAHPDVKFILSSCYNVPKEMFYGVYTTRITTYGCSHY